MSQQPPPQLPQEFIDEYSGGRLIGVAVAFIPILIFFVGIRFWSRSLSRTPLGLDDFLAAFSLVFQIGVSALAICESLHFLTVFNTVCQYCMALTTARRFCEVRRCWTSLSGVGTR